MMNSNDDFLTAELRFPENANGVKNNFICHFDEYKKRIAYLYALAPFTINEMQFYLIITNLKQRAIKGRILPNPEKVLMIVKRLSKRSVKNGYCRVYN